MLYDKRWEKPEVKADPLKMESLIAWLETMPAEKGYDYEDCRGKCLYGLYMAAHGIPWKESGGTTNCGYPRARDWFCSHVYAYVANPRPWTFGEALKRARNAPTEIDSF